MLMMMTDLGTVHKTNPTCHTNDFCEDNGLPAFPPARLSLSTRRLHEAGCRLQVCPVCLGCPAVSISQKCCTTFREFLERQKTIVLHRAALCCSCVAPCGFYGAIPLFPQHPKAGQYFYCRLQGIYEIQIASAKSYDPALGLRTTTEQS